MKSRSKARAAYFSVTLPKTIIGRLEKHIADKWGADPRWRGMKQKFVRRALIEYLDLRGVK